MNGVLGLGKEGLRSIVHSGGKSSRAVGEPMNKGTHIYRGTTFIVGGFEVE